MRDLVTKVDYAVKRVLTGSPDTFFEIHSPTRVKVSYNLKQPRRLEVAWPFELALSVVQNGG